MACVHLLLLQFSLQASNLEFATFDLFHMRVHGDNTKSLVVSAREKSHSVLSD
jgi:hypothetical protein